MNGSARDVLGDRLLPAGTGVRGIEAARAEEQSRRNRAGDDGHQHCDGDAGDGQKEHERIELHVGDIVSSRGDPEVGPKVPAVLGPSALARTGRGSHATAFTPEHVRSERTHEVVAPRILVMSRDPVVREGWARYFEARGLAVSRCTGPEARHCALELGPHCPLQEAADAAYYDNAYVSDELALALAKRPRLLQMFFADDRVVEGHHQPQVTRSI